MTENTAESREALRARADRRFAEALERAGVADPRERYREWLRELRSTDEPAFRKALEYYEGHLLPAVADPPSDPVVEWTEYGLRLAQRLRPGGPVRIDSTGLSHACDATAPPEDLILHLPTSTRERALPVRQPSRLSPAQAATVEVLVRAGT